MLINPAVRKINVAADKQPIQHNQQVTPHGKHPLQGQWWHRLHGNGGRDGNDGRDGNGGRGGGIGQHHLSGYLIDDKKSTMASINNGRTIRAQFIGSLGGSTTGAR